MRSKIKDKIKDSVSEPVVNETCIHYWIIDSPHGSKSNGRCKFCGAEREFDNWLSFTPRDEYTSFKADSSDTTVPDSSN